MAGAADTGRRLNTSGAGNAPRKGRGAVPDVRLRRVGATSHDGAADDRRRIAASGEPRPTRSYSAPASRAVQALG
ncbi:hypothetical protein GCM10011578_012450 [Streptomyces fuscichromogenes]|uniref:Uncharacterized protein n=1 Tax=Streptomyces fuscichromogenes TaxID=1324013 RepID=A0A917UK87_9ACTN|nr:hypothetical protein GCM10011578_012450 [Streptomyces fuscichromogenes]